MIQASSLLVNTELNTISGEVIGSFLKTALILALVAFAVVTAVALYAGSDTSRDATTEKSSIRNSLAISLIFGGTAFLFFFVAIFYMQAAILTDHLSNPMGFVVGVVQAIVTYIGLIVAGLMMYLIGRLVRTTSKFFHRHPVHLG